MSCNETTLISRLRVCLVTILELEEALQDSALGHVLQAELVSLRQVFDNLEHIAVLEEDVLRIEQATGRFLEELKVPLQGVAVYKPAVDRVLQ